VEQRVSLVTLGVSDVARARAFYEALGWKGESADESTVFFQAGGMIVALWDRALLAADSGITDDGSSSSVALAHNVSSSDAVDRILEEASAAGATIVRPGAPTFWGGYSGVFKDVDGHPWEVAHNPGWPIAADGSVSLH
jgi:predicted lactoylglutathione lyase